MAVDLVASLRLNDQITRPLRRVMRNFSSLTSSVNQLSGQSGNAQNSLNRLGSSTRGVASSASTANGSMRNLIGTLGGVAAAYLTVRGAAKALDATIGADIRYEQSTVAVEAIFNDKGASDAYLKMVENMALSSPLLSSGEMLGASKGLVAMTKNVDDLGDAWSIVERLQVLDPTQGTDGAAFALKEMWQGDALSMVERFGLNKSELNKIKKLDIPSQIAAINGMLNKMGVTQETVDKMGGTTAGVWQQITERAESAMRQIGAAPNGTLNEFLSDILTKFEKLDVTALANSIGNKLNAAITTSINIFNGLADAVNYVKTNKDAFIQTGRTVISVVAGIVVGMTAFKVAMTAMSIISTITTLISAYRAGTLLATAAQLGLTSAMWLSPTTWIIAGIAALIGIGVALALNWDYVKERTMALWDSIGGLGGAMALILGPVGFLINAAIDLAKNWDSTKSVWENVWGAIQRSAATSINAIIGVINSMIDTINLIPFVEIKGIGKVEWGNTTAPTSNYTSATTAVPGFYHGLDNVPYDNMHVRVHRGERILTAQENKEYSSGQGNGGGSVPVINIAHMEVRQESDIEKIAYELAHYIAKESFQVRY